MGTQSQAIVDKLLTNVSNMLNPQGMISEQILPEIKVKQRTGKIGGYGNQHLRIVDSVVGGKAEYPMIDTVIRTSDTYTIESHALKDIVTQEDYDNVEKPYDAEADKVEGLSTSLFLGKEKALADALGSTSVITQNETLSGTAQFSDYDNSNPNLKFKDARLAVRAGCGFAPNTAIMDWSVAETLRFHPILLDVLGFKDNRPNGLTDMELARALNVKRVLIAEAVYNNSREGEADVLAPVWGKHLVFAHVAERAGLRQKSLGYRMQLTGRSPRQVYKFNQDEPINSKKIMVIDDYQQLILDDTCAFLYKDAIA